jgi:hypothetical protein
MHMEPSEIVSGPGGWREIQNMRRKMRNIGGNEKYRRKRAIRAGLQNID